MDGGEEGVEVVVDDLVATKIENEPAAMVQKMLLLMKVLLSSIMEVEEVHYPIADVQIPETLYTNS